MLSRDMSYPTGRPGISLHGMPHLPALGRETPKRMDLRPLFSRIVGPWVLSLLVATWPKGTVAGKPQWMRRGRYLR